MALVDKTGAIPFLIVAGRTYAMHHTHNYALAHHCILYSARYGAWACVGLEGCVLGVQGMAGFG